MNSNDTIDYMALVLLIEEHWQEFVELSCGEDLAEKTLHALRKKTGMGGEE